jgi:hypothetical protein
MVLIHRPEALLWVEGLLVLGPPGISQNDVYRHAV